MSLDVAAEKIRLWRDKPVAFVEERFGIKPDAWQREALEAFPHSPRIAMKAPIALDHIVWTPTGSKRWGDVVVGDSLFAEDGSVTSVLKRYDAGKVPLWRVTFRDGTSLRVSGDHEWDVQTPADRRSPNFKWRTVTTNALRAMALRAPSGQRLINIPKQWPAEFPEAVLPADPYIFGLWLGDGIANEPRLICPDPGIRAEIRRRGQRISESAAVKKRIGLTGWAPALRATGMMACRSYEKYIPHVFKLASVTQRLWLLQGLMDSDGTCAKNGHTYLASCSLRLIEDFLWLARSLGYLATRMGPYKINGGTNRDSYRAIICGLDCPFLADTPKRRRWRMPENGKTFRFIESIDTDGRGDAMCVEIAHPSHCFQASDFIVTHNCKGPGKTAVLAWLGWNFLLTRPHARGGATSISGDNLKANLWTELAIWRARDPLLEAAFEMTKTEIFARESPNTWKLEARTWAKDANAEQIGHALAGLHGEYVLWLLDESGGYPPAILPTCEAILSGDPKEAHVVQAGNPISLTGALYHACTTARALWKVIEITGDPDDPKRSPRIPVQYARDQIAQYGADNPWVLVNIFGRFPPSSINTLISADECSAAVKRAYREADIAAAARVLGIDVARFGDDASVMFPRQGLVAFEPKLWRNIDSLQGSGAVAHKITDWSADATFVDDTGGYGAAWIDGLRRLGHSPIPVQFAGRPHDPRYYNKRAEMYFDAAEWIKEGGQIPNCPELIAAMTRTTYTFKGDKLLLEDKGQVKERLGYSPDHADAFVTTFAQPVLAKRRGKPGRLATAIAASYDEFSEVNRPRAHA